VPHLRKFIFLKEVLARVYFSIKVGRSGKGKKEAFPVSL
jgi:hypothetical protein